MKLAGAFYYSFFTKNLQELLLCVGYVYWHDIERGIPMLSQTAITSCIIEGLSINFTRIAPTPAHV